MIELTQTLIDRGHAYVVDSGSVYYDVTSFPGYGKLSGNTLDKLREGHRDLETDPAKRNAADFALWKAAGPGRLMKWDSPWGEGFPGLAHRVLGDVDEVPGRPVRHPHRGQRPPVPPPRGRDRAERRARSATGRVDLGARRATCGNRGRRSRSPPGNTVRVPDLDRARVRSARVPVADVPDAYRSRDGLHVGCDGGRRPARASSCVAAWPQWGAPATELGEAAKGFDARFREAVANDLRHARRPSSW